MAVTNRYELIGSLNPWADLRLLAGRMNGLREAIKRRMILCGANQGPLPPILNANDPARLESWLTAARASIEGILATNKFGRLVRNETTGECPWTPWNKYDLITKIRTGWTAYGWGQPVSVNNFYTMNPGEWMLIQPWPEDKKFHEGYYNELVLACELLVFHPISTTIIGNAVLQNRTVHSTGPDAWTAYITAYSAYGTTPWTDLAPIGNPTFLAIRDLYFDSWTGSWSCSMYGYRCRTWDLQIPPLAYNAKEFFMGYNATWDGPPPWPLGELSIGVWDQPNFSGNQGRTAGRFYGSEFFSTYIFDGWMVWNSDLNNSVKSFSATFANVDNNWEYPPPWDPRLSVPFVREVQRPNAIGPTFGRFDFDGYTLGSTFWFPEQYEHWFYPSF